MQARRNSELDVSGRSTGSASSLPNGGAYLPMMPGQPPPRYHPHAPYGQQQQAPPNQPGFASLQGSPQQQRLFQMQQQQQVQMQHQMQLQQQLRQQQQHQQQHQQQQKHHDPQQKPSDSSQRSSHAYPTATTTTAASPHPSPRNQQLAPSSSSSSQPSSNHAGSGTHHVRQNSKTPTSLGASPSTMRSTTNPFLGAPPMPSPGGSNHHLHHHATHASLSSSSSTTPGAPLQQQSAAITSVGGPLKPGSKKPTVQTSKSPTATTVASATSTGATSIPPLSLEDQQARLSECLWPDKTLWVSRQLLGGQSVNGFLRATATAQRIKKQRARQTKSTKKDDDTSVASGGTSTTTKKRPEPSHADPATEEALKKEVMNSRTAKKLKSEFESGLQFCALMHETIRKILRDMGKHAPPTLNDDLPVDPPPRVGGVAAPIMVRPSMPGIPTKMSVVPSSSKKPPPPAQMVQTQSSSSSTSSSAGNPGGSALRRNRKKKIPPSNEPSLDLPELAPYKKKDYLQKVFEVVRFRSLRPGDLVAARVTSRDLWILAKITQPYPGIPNNLNAADFVNLTEARRQQLFRDKVSLIDVEDKEQSIQTVARNLVLPLPRSFGEAAVWGARWKKGARVYAMYPKTTALYSATVTDNTTYCQDEDDILVVEFDGDEPDATGSIPKCHVPARFVVLIPPEFPGAQANANHNNTSNSNNNTSKKKRQAPAKKSTLPPPQQPQQAPAVQEDPLHAAMDMNFGPLDLDGLDDLDFDLLGGT